MARGSERGRGDLRPLPTIPRVQGHSTTIALDAGPRGYEPPSPGLGPVTHFHYSILSLPSPGTPGRVITRRRYEPSSPGLEPVTRFHYSMLPPPSPGPCPQSPREQGHAAPPSPRGWAASLHGVVANHHHRAIPVGDDRG
ncbi:hypothetical protein KC19_3G209000 [Ceratodon purpureus]|uniref:Uncharacterized protein n=1 Tax=Ceratodon purpureus TaxID=3225 RepID=A0A8T0IKW9_CERPU|nr:hypothetical protein KC19_3G209000 [Ceratodon purpureus]